MQRRLPALNLPAKLTMLTPSCPPPPVRPPGAPSPADQDANEFFPTLAILRELNSLTALTRLRGVWLSDDLCPNPGELLLTQHHLQAFAPRVCVRPAPTDWFWKSSFPIGARGWPPRFPMGARGHAPACQRVPSCLVAVHTPVVVVATQGMGHDCQQLPLPLPAATATASSHCQQLQGRSVRRGCGALLQGLSWRKQTRCCGGG